MAWKCSIVKLPLLVYMSFLLFLFFFFTFLFCYFYGSLSVFIKNTQVMSLSFNVCCRLNNSLPKVSTCESPEPKNMLPHMVKGTLQM